MKVSAQNDTYDEIYMEMWELSQRYPMFTSFRVIGNSHDGRLIPMIEIGHGPKVLFCIGGLSGIEQWTVWTLLQIAKEYCNYYEKNWTINEFYYVQNLLNKIRLCVIPMANPDGYEICRKGYRFIRNPVYRQILRMQEIPYEEFKNNARNVYLEADFPMTSNFNTEEMMSIPMENETRAMIRIFYEYDSVGLLEMGQAFGSITCYRSGRLPINGKKEAHLTRYIKKRTQYYVDSKRTSKQRNFSARGNCAQFYTKELKHPSFRIELPFYADEMINDKEITDKMSTAIYENVRTIPLEFIFTISGK